MKWLVPVALTLAAAAALASRRNAATSGQGTVFVPSSLLYGESPDGPPVELAPDQQPDLLDSIAVTLNPSTYIPAGVDDDTAQRNVRAFLDTIAYSEGADYNTLVGGGTFDDFSDHPRRYITVRPGLVSSAAGRYQFLARTWDGLRARLGLPDFSPASQDAGAIELIRQRGALRDVQAGRFASAIDKVRPIWASLPGAGYGQPERSFQQLQAVYAQAGGSFA